jgi:eukaryotic-like serine/threonine-protein kinase
VAAALADRYEVTSELGRGGMATVYLARDRRHARLVAVKVLRPELAAMLGGDRFLQEIRITAGLQHPHILPLLDSGISAAPEFLYYVMPYVEGESLRARLERERQLPLEEAVRYAGEVADALGYAHARGIVHRDIKPENILLSSGHAVIADFGIARAVSEAGAGRFTQPGLAVGTPAYMSPEQAAGEQEIDGRSDLYSLGSVLYEMLAGRPPFQGPTAQALLARLFTETPAPLRTLRDAVPTAVEQAVKRALAREPGARFATGGEMAGALRGVVREERGAEPARSLAVLPFVNLNADPENEFFSDGMTDELIGALASLEGLHVVSRTSAFAFKGKHEDIRTIGDRLNVQTILEGSVRRAGRRLRVAAQLVNVADGFQLWSETFDRELEDVFAIQDQIAGAITAALEVRLLGRSRRQPPTADLEAYSLYLKGRHFWNRRTEEALRTGLGFFEEALARDPDYALAHSGVADSHLILGFYCANPPMEAFPVARAAALRALELDPSLAEARVALAYISMYHDWDWVEADRQFQEGIRLNPGYSTAHQWYGNFLATQGRFEESLAAFGRAIALDPLSPLKTGALGWGCYFARRYEEAAGHHRQALVLDPAYAVAHLWLGLALEQMGEVSEALAAFDAAVRLSGHSPIARCGAAHAEAKAGRRDEARRAAAELAELRSSRFVSAYDIATIHSGLGDTATALDWLERGYEERTHWMALLGVDPRLDPLRQEPRFQALMGGLRLG